MPRLLLLLPVLTAWHAAGETDKARQLAETERARVRTDEDRLEALVLALAAGDREAARALGEAVEDPGARGLVHAYIRISSLSGLLCTINR